MKSIKNTKITLLIAVFGLVTLVGNSSFTSSETSSMPSSILFAGNTDAQFLSKAAHLNLEEIQLGKLAQDKSTLSDVQDLGRLMETNHTQALNDLTRLANKKGIVLPTTLTAEAKSRYKELNSESEKHFSEEYCEFMIKGHKHAIALFESIAKDAQDTEIREWAAATLPMLHTHLKQAEMCKEKCEKMP